MFIFPINQYEHNKKGTWTQEIFGGGKFWRTVQVKAIGEEKFGE